MIKEKFSRAFIAVVLIMMVTMVSCGGGSNNQVNNESQQAHQEPVSLLAPVPDNAVSISPVEFIAYGKTYRITKYEIKKDEQDKIIIIASGSGFDKMQFTNGEYDIPVLCAYISKGKEVYAKSVSVNRTSITYFFETSDEPETVILYPADNPDNRIEIKN